MKQLLKQEGKCSLFMVAYTTKFNGCQCFKDCDCMDEWKRGGNPKRIMDLIERRDRLLYKQITSGYGLTPFEGRELRDIKSWIWNVEDQINRLDTYTI